MEDLKFRVRSKEHSIAIQEQLFLLGVEWRSNEAIVLYENEPYLYVINNELMSGHLDSTFIDNDGELSTLDDLYEIKERVKIGEYDVHFNKTHIKVGYTTVSNDLLKKIYDRQFNS